MKTTLMSLSLLCLFSFCLQAQISEAQFIDLENRIRSLKMKDDSLEHIIADIDSNRLAIESKLLNMYHGELLEMEFTIKDAFDKTDVISISATYQEVIKSIITLHNEITMINNFTDAEKVFGIDFAKKISEIAERTLVGQLMQSDQQELNETKENRKKLLRNVVKSIIYNPVISGILKSNPISSVAHSILNQTFNLYQNKLDKVVICRGDYTLPQNYKEFKNNYGAFKKSYENSSLSGITEPERLILDQSVMEFTEELKPLIMLFDELSGINEKYESSLDVFMKASEQTIERVKPMEKEFFKIVKSSNRKQARETINQFFNVGSDPDLNTLETKLNDQRMKSLLKHSAIINEGLLLLKNDFLKIITLEIELAQEYIDYFKGLKEGEGSLSELVNVESINLKISQFDQLRFSLMSQKQKLDTMGITN